MHNSATLSPGTPVPDGSLVYVPGEPLGQSSHTFTINTTLVGEGVIDHEDANITLRYNDAFHWSPSTTYVVAVNMLDYLYGNCTNTTCIFKFNVTATGLLLPFSSSSTVKTNSYIRGISSSSAFSDASGVELYLAFQTSVETVKYTIKRPSMPAFDYAVPVVKINNRTLSGSTTKDSTNTFSSIENSILNVTITLSEFDVATQLSAPFGLAIYADPEGIDTELKGVQRLCTTSGSDSEQGCASGILDTNSFSFISGVRTTALVINRVYLPSIQASNEITLRVDFRNRTISIVSPPGASMSAFSSDVERYFFLNMFGQGVRNVTSVVNYYADYTRLTGERAKTKITVFVPDRNYPMKRLRWISAAVDISSPNPRGAFPVHNYTFPCPGAGNETRGGVNCADECDSDRFTGTAIVGGANKTCGQCASNRFGPYCQYSGLVSGEATLCSIRECNSFGSCSGTTRACSCNTMAFAAAPVEYRYGSQCEYTQQECIKELCGGIGACMTWDPWVSSATLNFEQPTCVCGSVNNSIISVNRLSHASGCTECPEGSVNSTAGICDKCKPGYYGNNCQFQNATACALVTQGMNGCSSNGTCAYVYDIAKYSARCNCTEESERYGMFCDKTASQACSDVGALLIYSKPEGELTRFYCNHTTPLTTCVSSGLSYAGGALAMNYARLLNTSCYICPDTFVRKIAPGQQIAREDCDGCIQGYFGRYCNYTSATTCGADLCSGRGVCAIDKNFGDNWNTHRCICNSGFAGYACENTTAEINTQRCSGNGTAFVTYTNAGAYSFHYCICNTDRFGLNCEMTAEQCRVDLCASSGTCGPLAPSFTYKTGCNCDVDRWGTMTGSSSCSQHNASIAICNNRGVYSQTSDRFWNCTCNNGYFGAYCELEAAKCRQAVCNSNGACVSPTTPVRFDISRNIFAAKYTPKCDCDAGYSGDFCQTVDEVFTLVNSSQVDNGYIDPSLQPYINATILDSGLEDFGLEADNSSFSNAGDIVAANWDEGVAFVFSPTNSETIQSLPSIRSYNALNKIFSRVTTSVPAFTLSSGNTTNIITEPNVFVKCSIGSTVGSTNNGFNLTLQINSTICIDNGVYGEGCYNKAATGYVNASILTIQLMNGSVRACPIITISEIGTNHSITVVTARQATASLIGRTGFVKPNNVYNNQTDVVVVNGFTSSNGSLHYIVGRHTSPNMSASATRMFVDIWSGNTVTNGGNTTYNLTFVIRQYLDNPFTPYDGTRAIWAPISQRLIVRNPQTNWNMIPLDPESGLFDSGFIIAAKMPGNDFDPWRDEVCHCVIVTILILFLQHYLYFYKKQQ